jgi:outer membrane lipoprotein-sorting protein
MKPRLLFLAAGVVLWLGGCASVPRANLAGKSVTPEMVQNVVRVNRERVQSLSGSGSISVESPDMAQSGSFEVFLHKPDSVLVKIEGPFGIQVGSALLTRTGFLFYNSLQNQLVTGPVNAANMNRIFRVNLTFDELLNLFTGGNFLPGDEKAPDSLVIEGNQFVLSYGDASGSRRYWIDPATLLIAKIQLTDSKGKLVLEERFERFRDAGDASLPRHIRITQHQARRVVAVAFSSLDINTERVPLVVDVPTNAERVRWK